MTLFSRKRDSEISDKTIKDGWDSSASKLPRLPGVEPMGAGCQEEAGFENTPQHTY